MRLFLVSVLFMLACTVPTEDSGDKPVAEREGDDAGDCADGTDNDLDGLSDCDDADCFASPDCDTGDTGDTETDDCPDGPEIVDSELSASVGFITASLTLSSASSPGDMIWIDTWWDGEVDGVVDTTGEAVEVGPSPVEEGQTVGVAFFVTGEWFDYGTTYELAFQVSDFDECSSNLVIGSVTTLDEDADTDTGTDTDTTVCEDATLTGLHEAGRNNETFVQCCPDGEVLVGFTGMSSGDPDYYIGGLTPVCGVLTGSCDSGTGVVTISEGTTLSSYGANGSESWERTCADGEAVVGYGGSAGWWFDALTFSCAPITLDCTTGTYSVGTATELETYGGTGGDPIAPAACDAGTVGVGAAIGTGFGEGAGYITAVGLACDELVF